MYSKMYLNTYKKVFLFVFELFETDVFVFIFVFMEMKSIHIQILFECVHPRPASYTLQFSRYSLDKIL